MNSRYYSPEWSRFISADNLLMQDSSLLSNNLYAYANNNPINMSDSEGNWPTWNDIKNAGKAVGNAIVNTGKAIVNTVANTGKAIVNNFVAEGGCGTGAGASLAIGKLDTKLTYYQDVAYGIKNLKTYSNITGNAGLQIAGFGPSWSYEHPYPFPKDFSYWESDRFNRNNILQSKYIKHSFSFDTPLASFESDNVFIGLGGSAHFGYGCHFKIGWDTK